MSYSTKMLSKSRLWLIGGIVVVGLAAGARKLRPTLALARGGVLDVLIVDAPLARQLLEAVKGA